MRNRRLVELRRIQEAIAASAGIELSDDAFLWSQDIAGHGPIYPDTITSRFTKLKRAAGIPQVQLRQLRHFAATQLLAAGVDVRTVAGRLGHARPAMTLDRYSAWVPASDRATADVLHDITRIG